MRNVRFYGRTVRIWGTEAKRGGFGYKKRVVAPRLIAETPALTDLDVRLNGRMSAVGVDAVVELVSAGKGPETICTLSVQPGACKEMRDLQVPTPAELGRLEACEG